MRFITMLIIFGSFGAGGYWAWNTFPQLKGTINEVLNMGKLQAKALRALRLYKQALGLLG